MSAFLGITRRPGAVFIYRLLTGGFFAAAGLAKLAQPAELFANQIKAFGVLPSGWEHPLAQVLPWAELVSGGLLLAGLYSRMACTAVAAQLAMFTAALSLAVAWGVAPEDCGCLPGVSETPAQALGRDVLMLAWTGLAWRGLPGGFSVDGWLAATKGADE